MLDFLHRESKRPPIDGYKPAHKSEDVLQKLSTLKKRALSAIESQSTNPTIYRKKAPTNSENVEFVERTDWTALRTVVLKKIFIAREAALEAQRFWMWLCCNMQPGKHFRVIKL
jgi:hypothetical protein